jgi:hypothetical protein
MPACLFCKRTEIPRVPMYPTDLNLLVAHVGPTGEPCHEGAAPETHANMLGADYPHDDLLDGTDADGHWDFDASDTSAPGVTPSVQISDPIEAAARKLEPELSVDLPTEIRPNQDVERHARPTRKPRKRRDDA